jgi:hypothetical protein
MLLLWVVEARLRHQVQILLLAWFQPLLLVVDMAQTLLALAATEGQAAAVLVVQVPAMRVALRLAVKVLLVVGVSLMVYIPLVAVVAATLP